MRDFFGWMRRIVVTQLSCRGFISYLADGFGTHDLFMLQIQSVTKRYGPLTALDGVSLEIVRGEFFGLLGPNGAGKSTLMSLISGLRAADAGILTLDGVQVTAANHSTRLALGLVP